MFCGGLSILRPQDRQICVQMAAIFFAGGVFLVQLPLNFRNRKGIIKSFFNMFCSPGLLVFAAPLRTYAAVAPFFCKTSRTAALTTEKQGRFAVLRQEKQRGSSQRAALPRGPLPTSWSPCGAWLGMKQRDSCAENRDFCAGQSRFFVCARFFRSHRLNRTYPRKGWRE